MLVVKVVVGVSVVMVVEELVVFSAVVKDSVVMVVVGGPAVIAVVEETAVVSAVV